MAELLDGGHAVTVYARNPEKVPDSWHQAGNRVRVVIGEITDGELVDQAVAGADAVISALGPSLDRSTTGLPLVQGTATILAAMARHDVDRFIGHATPSILDPRERPTWQTRLFGRMARTIFPRAHRELLGLTELIMAADLRWTIIRFTAPKDGPRTDRLQVGFYGSDRNGWAVTRADVAAFTAAQVDDDTYLRAAPAISN